MQATKLPSQANDEKRDLLFRACSLARTPDKARSSRQPKEPKKTPRNEMSFLVVHRRLELRTP